MRRGTSKAEVVEYRGHRYRRYPNGKNRAHQRYFYATEPRRGFLHRHIWEDEVGPIPDGHEIHHRDENWDNNTLDNFECLTRWWASFERALYCSGGCKQRGEGGGATRRGRFAPEGEAVACVCCHRRFVTKWPEYSKYCSKACGMRYRDRGAFKEGEGPKPHRKTRAHILCERHSDP